jgi:hypothetical protein
MSTLAERVVDLGRRLEYGDDDHRATVEAAALLAASTAARRRPRALPPAVSSHDAATVARARAATLTGYLELRNRLVAESLSTAELARRLGVSAAAVTKRRLAGTVLAFRHKGDWRYPAWQVSGTGELVPGLVAVLRALPDRVDLGRVAWFEEKARNLGGRGARTPRSALLAGDAEAVVAAASYVGSR